jgi:hypothetical protein
MQLFVLTTHCTSRAHCKVCRNLSGGRLWRKSLAKAYTLPAAPADAADPADFECPFGLSWIAPSEQQIENNEKVKLAKTQVRRNTGSRGGGCGCSRGK